MRDTVDALANTAPPSLPAVLLLKRASLDSSRGPGKQTVITI